VRRGLQLGAEARVGAIAIAGVAFLVSLPLASAEAAFQTVHTADLWPFALAGTLMPGSSQILFILAGRAAMLVPFGYGRGHDGLRLGLHERQIQAGVLRVAEPIFVQDSCRNLGELRAESDYRSRQVVGTFAIRNRRRARTGR
jgi:hypothetical protein